jgi:hypothetical protein
VYFGVGKNPEGIAGSQKHRMESGKVDFSERSQSYAKTSERVERGGIAGCRAR